MSGRGRDQNACHHLLSGTNEVNIVSDDKAIAVAELLADNTTCATLSCSGSVSDRGVLALAEALKTNRALRKLSLNYTTVGDEGACGLAEALKTNGALRVLTLFGTQVGDEGACGLAEALKTNGALRQLHLYYTNVGDDVACDLAEALKTNGTLRVLFLNGTNVGDNGACGLAEALKTNGALRELDLSGTIVGDEGACGLAEALKTNGTLRVLDLNGTQVGDEGACGLAEALKTNGALREMHFGDSKVGDEGACDLAEALKTNGTLRVLFLNGTNVGDNGACGLAEALKTNGALRELDLGRTQVGDEGACGLAEALKTNGTLRVLDLNGTQVGDNGACGLAEALKTNGALREMHLGSTQVGDEGACDLAEALKTNGALRVLFLNGTKVGDEGACGLAEALKTNGALREMHLGDSKVGDEGACGLAEALKTNGALRVLFLNGTKVGDDVACGLAEAFKTNGTLRVLFLNGTKVGDEGACGLAEALKTNGALRVLHLGSTQVGDEGACGLAEALKTNGALRELNLESTKVVEVWREKVRQALEGRCEPVPSSYTKPTLQHIMQRRREAATASTAEDALDAIRTVCRGSVRASLEVLADASPHDFAAADAACEALADCIAATDTDQEAMDIAIPAEGVIDSVRWHLRAAAPGPGACRAAVALGLGESDDPEDRELVTMAVRAMQRASVVGGDGSDRTEAAAASCAWVGAIARKASGDARRVLVRAGAPRWLGRLALDFRVKEAGDALAALVEDEGVRGAIAGLDATMSPLVRALGEDMLGAASLGTVRALLAMGAPAPSDPGAMLSVSAMAGWFGPARALLEAWGGAAGVSAIAATRLRRLGQGPSESSSLSSMMLPASLLADSDWMRHADGRLQYLAAGGVTTIDLGSVPGPEELEVLAAGGARVVEVGAVKRIATGAEGAPEEERGRIPPLNLPRGKEGDGQGVNGFVFAVRTTEGRELAVKGMLPFADASRYYSKDVIQKHREEWRVPRVLGTACPHIVPVLHSFFGSAALTVPWVGRGLMDLGVVARRTTWIVMPRYPTSLHSAVKTKACTGRREAALWLLGALEATQHMLRRGAVHRDVKDDNLFLAEDGRIVLGDFGSGRLLFKRGVASELDREFQANRRRMAEDVSQGTGAAGSSSGGGESEAAGPGSGSGSGRGSGDLLAVLRGRSGRASVGTASTAAAAAASGAPVFEGAGAGSVHVAFSTEDLGEHGAGVTRAPELTLMQRGELTTDSEGEELERLAQAYESADAWAAGRVVWQLLDPTAVLPNCGGLYDPAKLPSAREQAGPWLEAVLRGLQQPIPELRLEPGRAIMALRAMLFGPGGEAGLRACAASGGSGRASSSGGSGGKGGGAGGAASGAGADDPVVRSVGAADSGDSAESFVMRQLVACARDSRGSVSFGVVGRAPVPRVVSGGGPEASRGEACVWDGVARREWLLRERAVDRLREECAALLSVREQFGREE